VATRTGAGAIIHSLARANKLSVTLIEEAARKTLALEFYLRPQRPFVATLAREFHLLFSVQSMPVPNWRTIRRRIEELDLTISLQKRDGAKKAQEKVARVSLS
jgi:hypothetical protein